MGTVSNLSAKREAMNILDTAAANGSFKTFGRAVEHAGMGDTLRGPGQFTVFAPTDAAFDNLPAGKLEALFRLENRTELVSLLNYHVLNGRKSVADLGRWELAKTVNGQYAPIKRNGDKVSIDGAEVSTSDLASSNGMVHGIDKVNIPTGN